MPELADPGRSAIFSAQPVSPVGIGALSPAYTLFSWRIVEKVAAMACTGLTCDVARSATKIWHADLAIVILERNLIPHRRTFDYNTVRSAEPTVTIPPSAQGNHECQRNSRLERRRFHDGHCCAAPAWRLRCRGWNRCCRRRRISRW